MNLSSTIIPRSDQLNADDLLSGPRTITITSVDAGNKEQPILIHYEGENGRPYKPGLSMRRVLVAMWGSEGSAYVGRSLTLYCDPSITFGPDTTGGIRISHATDITCAITIALTVKRGKRKPFTVEPLVMPSAAKSRPIDELVAAGDSISLNGTDALGKWWNENLSKAERVLLKDRIGAWKEIAGKVTS